MKLEKGKLYKVRHFSHMQHCIAEYHSSYHSDDEAYHYMIVRLKKGSLFLIGFGESEIFGQVENNYIL